MAQIIIKTTPEEQATVLAAIKRLEGQTVSVNTIAREAHMNPNRVRYVVTDLLDAGKIKREVTKAFNERYIRYSYRVV